MRFIYLLIRNMIQLNEDQQRAFDFIIDAFQNESVVLLTGFAGTGKTQITKYISVHFAKSNTSICAIAPTHKAKRVIENILNQQKIIPIPAYTVASMLGKMKEHSYIGTKNYTKGHNKKFVYQLFILDEVSMVDDKDTQFIINFIKKNNRKLLLIGDDCQIPCPSAGYITDGEIIEKANSFVFTDPHIANVKLTRIVRQVEGSVIYQLSQFVRDHQLVHFKIEESGYPYIINQEDAYLMYAELYKHNAQSCKMISYTNQSVRTHNNEIRKAILHTQKLMVNDLLTGYQNVGWPELIIENGRDYFITKIQPTINYKILHYTNLSGNLVTLRIVDNNVIIPNLFFIDLHAESNYQFINDLIERAEKVNAIRSTKMDYMNYTSLKLKVFFIEDVYKYRNQIYSECDFHETHALLFTKIDEVIKNNAIIPSKLTEKINTQYENIIEERLEDDKVIADSETLADKLKVIEKDIYYGYAITTHKSQGSTYHSVIVDECDYDIINDRYNYRYGKLESKLKEKNQLRYVAYTRAQNNLYIVH